MRINDDYTAFCFDEACAEILARLEAGEQPNYKETEKEKRRRERNIKHYSTFSSFYQQFE